MNPEVKFLETLKKLGFPRANEYSAADFQTYFSDPELQPFLEYFCILDEENVLTSEELEEYASISPQEMKELEELVSNDAENFNEDNALKEEEAEFLSLKLNHLERKFHSLEEQKRTLLEHKAVVLEEKTDSENANKNLRRLFDDFSMNKVPQGIAQLSQTLETISELLSKLKEISDNVDDENVMLPVLNFKEEEKLSNLVLSNLSHNLQFEDESKKRLSIPGLSKEEITKEILILRNSLKVSKICESKSVINGIKGEKTALLVKKFQDGFFDHMFEMSVAQLSNKFAEATKLNECLTKKEALLLSNLSSTISERVDAQCNQIAIAHSNEVRLFYKNSLEKLSHPLKYLLNQRARLELLNLLISLHQKHWLDTKELLNQVFCFVNSEKENSLLKQQKLEKFLNQSELEETNLKPDSIFFSAYKVLSDDLENEGESQITLSDVVKSIEKLSKRKEFILKIAEENNDVIKILEKQYSDLEKMVSKGTDFDELMKVEKNFSTKVNQVEILLQEISNILRESEKEWQQKNKLLESKRNLKLARNLFIYALLERETFEGIIENIEEAAQHLA